MDLPQNSVLQSELDFDTSKENIQPLRGGRNASQLGVALQAQHNEEVQQELDQQKQIFEETIKNYDGPDPLDPYYRYIFWIEQSYPKQGHQSNIVPLLEDCIGKFEHDKRYANDYRFCKLWIKFIDIQLNPIELYMMLHAKGICIGIADMYKAWSYYHECVADFKSAEKVLDLGIKELAQPMDELLTAKEHILYAASQHSISGIDDRRLMEQRQALTMLRTHKPGSVGSVRTVLSGTPGVLTVNNASKPSSNTLVDVYKDSFESVTLSAGSAPVSVLTAARRDVTKENLLKPGVWTSGSKKRGALAVHKTPAFTLHEDVDEPPHVRGIMLPRNFCATSDNKEVVDWQRSPKRDNIDEPNKNVIFMQCKPKEVLNPGVEYSTEEIRAQRYKKIKITEPSVTESNPKLTYPGPSGSFDVFED